MDHLTIYKSSAGSGKTTVLSNEYLKLALKKNFRSILAVTFTNKATNELKERVIQQLHGYSNGVDSELGRELRDELGLTDSQFQKRCQVTLEAILNTYGAFSISTIDAFFQRIIRSFARETGIQGNFKLEIEHELILAEGVRLLLDDAGKNETLTRWLIRFSHEAAEQGDSSDLTGKIKDLGKEIFKERFATIESQVSSQGSIERFEELESELYRIKKGFSSKLSEAGRQIFDTLDRHGIAENDLKRGIWTQLSSLANGEIPDFSLSVFGAAVTAKENWYTKKSPRKLEINAAVEEGIMNALHGIKAFVETRGRDYYTASLILQNLYTFGILSNLLSKIESFKIENDILMLSDSSAFLARIIEGFDSPFIYEKVGTRYQHFLIDEFQDTSLYQWNNFRPLLENSLAEGLGSVVVGDVKQSIYRWRGGDWNLLGSEIENQIPNSQVRTLTKNWRSKPKVVEFNNKFFTDILNETVSLYSLTASKIADSDEVIKFQEHIRAMYSDVIQETNDDQSENEGFVKVRFLPGNDQEFFEASLQDIPQIVEQVQDSGLKARDIAILVRRKVEGEKVASHLIKYSKSEKARKDVNYDVVSADSLRVANSASVNLLVAVMKWINKPSDAIALLGFLSDYHRYFSPSDLDQQQLFEAYFSRKIAGCFPDGFEDELRQTSKLPLYELTEEIIRRFELKDNPGEWPYLLGFQDEVLKFTSTDSGDLSSFLELWDERGWEWPVNISDDIDAIQISTIHKAKGLEFEAVIVPFCNWKINPSKKDILWASTDVQPFDFFSFYPLRNTDLLAKSHFSGYYLKELADTYIDNLNLLYVAFTRASQALFAMIPDHVGRGRISKLLNNVFATARESGYIELGKMGFDIDADRKKDKRIELKTYHSGNWNSKVRVSTKELIKLDEEVFKKVETGVLMHDILSEIRVGNQLQKKLDKFHLMGRLPLSQRAEVESKLKELLSHEIIGQWFEEGRSINEKTLLTGNGQIRRPDKVVIGQDQLTVVDFKNGKERPEHLEQVKEYMEILEQFDKKKVEGYVLYLQPYSLVKVI